MEAVHQEGEEILAVLLCGPRKVRIMLPHHILGKNKETPNSTNIKHLCCLFNVCVIQKQNGVVYYIYVSMHSQPIGQELTS